MLSPGTARALALAIAVSAGAASFAPAAEGHRPLAGVALTQCTLATKSEAGSAEFTATMRARRGTRRMVLRYTLYERVGNGIFKRVSVPGLGVWRRSRAGVRRFVYRQRITGLDSGSAYRAEVSYRWIGRRGTRIRRARRRSAICAEPADLPNLRIATLRIGSGPKPDSVVYRVSVRNRSDAPVGAARVALTVDGREVALVELPSLGPLELKTVEIAGPRCESDVTATVDPEDRIEETNESDNTRSRVCR